MHSSSASICRAVLASGGYSSAAIRSCDAQLVLRLRVLKRVAVTAAAVVLMLGGCSASRHTDTANPEAERTTASERTTTSSTSTTTPARIPATSGPVENDPDLGANAFLRKQGVAPAQIDCALPAWVDDPAGAEAFYRAAIRCHDAAWRPALAQFGIAFVEADLWSGARVADYHGSCPINVREAFYCPSDRTIVMPFDSMEHIASFGVGYALAVVSHEYGHHIQQLTGIMPAFQARGAALGWDTPDADLLTRRLELQAWCFSGMFYGVNTGRGSITQGLANQALENNSAAGDRPGERRLHGTNQNIANWFSWGVHPSLDSNAAVTPSTYECNPWWARDQGWLQ